MHWGKVPYYWLFAKLALVFRNIIPWLRFDYRDGDLPRASEFLGVHPRAPVGRCVGRSVLPVCGHHPLVGDGMLHEPEETASAQKEKTRSNVSFKMFSQKRWAVFSAHQESLFIVDNQVYVKCTLTCLEHFISAVFLILLSPFLDLPSALQKSPSQE